jgi:hypothetical protein
MNLLRTLEYAISVVQKGTSIIYSQNSLPSNTSPSRLNAHGNIKTISGQLNTNLSIATDLGNAIIKGSFNEIDDPKKMGYNAKIETKRLDLGTILNRKKC